MRADIPENALTLDSEKRAIVMGGAEKMLPYKIWRVLLMLIEASPETVSREALINGIWDGNHLTGEKGLTQALWTIRSALADSARSPRYVMTIPRGGYQWIGPPPDWRAAPKKPAPRYSIPALAASLAAGFVIVAGIMLSREPSVLGGRAPVENLSGERAYFQGKDIILELKDKKVVFRPGELIRFSQPLFSEDGGKFAFRARKPGKCRFITFDLETLERHDFEGCAGRNDSAADRARLI